MRSPKLAALEFKRFARGRLPRAALVALLLLPLLYGALYLWSFWDPYSRLDRIPVALVNEDKGAVDDGKKVAAGADLVEGLHGSDTFDWREVSAEEAESGVASGKYYLSLTMPADFSKRIASSAGDRPETSPLRVETNDSNNYIVGQISRTVFSEVRSAASSKASRTFFDRIFIAFSDLHDQTAKAAKGASQLEGGIGQAKGGSQQLVDGLKEAKTGSGKLNDGMTKLDKGSKDLASGATQVADGTQQLADKVNGVNGKLAPFLRDNKKAIAHTAQLVADSTGVIREHLDTFVKVAPVAAEGTRKAADTLDEVYTRRCEQAAVADPACADLKKARDAAEKAAKLTADVDEVLKDYDYDVGRLDKQLATLQKQSAALAEAAPHLDKDLKKAVAQVNKLNSGAHQVAGGAGKLHTGLGTAHRGAKKLDSGLTRLEKGADKLHGGMFKLADGSHRLAGGLEDGVEQIPDYGDKDRDQRTGVMSDPVQLASQALHKAPNYGTGFAPYFIPLALWVGAMVAYMLITPLNQRALAAGASAWRITLAGWLPVAALGVAQAAALMAVLHWAPGMGLEVERAAGTAAFLVLVVGCYAAIVQWLNARFGAAGRILVLALLMLQLTSAGGTYPVETSPRFFNWIHPFLPMSYIVEALRRLITGGGLAPVWTGSVVLLAFLLGALTLTALSARRKQVWTFDRLHPELSL
ncbi:YhgE/Pip domain-containing protein [Streptomyces physcomitrii]|uniref:YhgE/Pip domain-containing protein n=1 Tax=Streptomyces physcomitrii TaxID=2724184 RepID=A0ABX1H095_9ACTN|nr:YhgE/Pip domain-containing protein [Streptomyces physcomitrii]NKI41418.1 YhgE/Pip domain-containing protein [Streptomyces physcomitrii]